MSWKVSVVIETVHACFILYMIPQTISLLIFDAKLELCIDFAVQIVCSDFSRPEIKPYCGGWKTKVQIYADGNCAGG